MASDARRGQRAGLVGVDLRRAVDGEAGVLADVVSAHPEVLAEALNRSVIRAGGWTRAQSKRVALSARLLGVTLQIHDDMWRRQHGVRKKAPRVVEDNPLAELASELDWTRASMDRVTAKVEAMVVDEEAAQELIFLLMQTWQDLTREEVRRRTRRYRISEELAWWQVDHDQPAQ